MNLSVDGCPFLVSQCFELDCNNFLDKGTPYKTQLVSILLSPLILSDTPWQLPTAVYPNLIFLTMVVFIIPQYALNNYTRFLPTFG